MRFEALYLMVFVREVILRTGKKNNGVGGRGKYLSMKQEFELGGIDEGLEVVFQK